MSDIRTMLLQLTRERPDEPVGLMLVHHYRVHSAGQPDAVFREKYLAQLRLLHLTGSSTPAPEKPLGNASPQVTHVSGKIDDWCARLRPPSEKPRGNAGPQVTRVSGKIDDSCAGIRPPSEKPLGNAGPQMTHMSGISDGLCARPRPPGRRRRSQRWIPNTATHVASRLTKQDPRTMAGAVVFDCRPAVLPVSVAVSGIDMQTVRRAEPPAEPPAEPVVAPTEREQEFTAPMWLNDIDPELEVTPLLDSGTDCQDELSSPDGSPMVISPIAGLLPSQGEDDINLARILAEFGTLPAFVSPIMDQYAEGEMPPTEYHPPEGKIDDSCARLRPPSEKPRGNAGPQVTRVSGKIDDSCARLRAPSKKPCGKAGPQVTHVSGRIDDSCARLRPPSETPLGNAGPQVTHVSGKIDDSCAGIRPPSEKPLGNASPQVTHMSGISDGLCARPRPPGHRRRSQRWITNTATHVASRLTKQDPRTMAGAVVFDCRPAVLPVSVDVSGIDMQTVRRAEPLAEPVVAPTEREQEFTAPMWLNDIDPELEATPLLDSGTDCQDELSSPDGSPMVISPIAGLLPSQGEDDINLARILAEFGTLPAFVSPIMDQYAEGEMPPTEYHPPELPPDLFVMPAGPGDGGSLTRDLTVPTFPPGNTPPAPEGMSGFPLHTCTWRSPPSEEKSTKFRLQPPETTVFQSEDNASGGSRI